MKEIHVVIIGGRGSVNGKGVFFILVPFIIMLVTCLNMVWAYPIGRGDHYLSKTCYPDESEGLTKVFTTEDWRVVCGVYGPFSLFCTGHKFRWYDPHGNQVAPAYANGSLVGYYIYEEGSLVCYEGYFYISGEQVAGEERELGRYRVDYYEEYEYNPIGELIFTDYFQICTNPSFEVDVDGATFNVTVLSNSTITSFNFSKTEKKISFNVTGSDDTWGFCNVTIPDDLLWGEFSVYKDGFPLEKDVDYTQTYNGTHYTFYITYTHTTHTIEIRGTEAIPEFPTWTSMLLILIVFTVAMAIYKRRLLKTLIN